MSTDILYPSLIGATCLVIVVVVHLLTRPKPSPADIHVPRSPHGAVDDAAPPTALDLAEWHRTHESSLLSFIEGFARDERPSSDEDDPSDPFAEAISSHPAPEMRAELSALRSAAEAVSAAADRGDDAVAERQHDVYANYRDAWLERLWQFPVYRERVASVRNSSDAPDED